MAWKILSGDFNQPVAGLPDFSNLPSRHDLAGLFCIAGNSCWIIGNTASIAIMVLYCLLSRIQKFIAFRDAINSNIYLYIAIYQAWCCCWLDSDHVSILAHSNSEANCNIIINKRLILQLQIVSGNIQPGTRQFFTWLRLLTVDLGSLRREWYILAPWHTVIRSAVTQSRKRTCK